MKKSDFKVYHETYTEAIQEVERFVEANNYFLDPEGMCSIVGFGPAKPQAGRTNSFSIPLYASKKSFENGRRARKIVHFQVYGIGHTEYLYVDKYELNVYIS